MGKDWVADYFTISTAMATASQPPMHSDAMPRFTSYLPMAESSVTSCQQASPSSVPRNRYAVTAVTGLKAKAMTTRAVDFLFRYFSHPKYQMTP